MSTDLVRVYLNTIGKTALLYAEQEVELAKRIEAGLAAPTVSAKEKTGLTAARKRDYKALAIDKAAKAHLLEANLRLVVSVAKRYTGHGAAFLDLIQEGNVGLIRAVEKFDYTQASSSPRTPPGGSGQAITRAMADSERAIRLPVPPGRAGPARWSAPGGGCTRSWSASPPRRSARPRARHPGGPRHRAARYGRDLVSLDQTVERRGVPAR